MLAFPGPEGYIITWSKGTHLLPMVHAPSGHLVLPCDGYEELASGIREETMTFVTDHTTPADAAQGMSRGSSNPETPTPQGMS